MLGQVVFLHATQPRRVDVQTVTCAENSSRVRLLHFQKHFVAANQDGAIFGGLVVHHHRYIGAFDVSGERMKVLRGAVQLPENAINGGWPVILGGRATARDQEEKQRKKTER